MKARISWLLLIAVVAFSGFVGGGSYANRNTQTASAPARVVWEYRTLQGDRALRDDQLNDAGLHGWELIMFDDGERGNGSFKGTYYFKRAK